MIVRVTLITHHGDRAPGVYVVDDGEARALAGAGVLAPSLELVTPQDDVGDDAIDALRADLFPAVHTATPEA
jgi:hypothetical protein